MESNGREQSVAVRRAAQGDLDALADIYADSLTGAPGEERWSQKSAREFLAMWLKRQPDLFFVAEVDGRIVGGTVCDLKPYFDGPRATDGEMFIDEKVRNLGVARALMCRQMDEAYYRFGVKTVESLANGHSEVVMGWCARIGFKRTDWVHMEVSMEQLRQGLGLKNEPGQP